MSTDFANRFCESIPAHLPQLRPTTSDSYMLASVLTHAAMAFILGHEVGHILEHHTGYRPGEQRRNHNMEFEADRWGLRTCLRHVVVKGAASGDRFVPKFMLLGPYLALGTIATISDVQGATHPAATERLARVEMQYEELLIEIGNRGLDLLKKGLDENFLEPDAVYWHKGFRPPQLIQRDR